MALSKRGSKEELISLSEIESILVQLDNKLEEIHGQKEELAKRLTIDPQNQTIATLLTKIEKIAKEIKSMRLEIEESQQIFIAAISAVSKARKEQSLFNKEQDKKKSFSSSSTKIAQPTPPGKVLGKFIVPDWIRDRSSASLIVSKNNECIATIDLSKRDCFILGKQRELVHIPLEHDSISRQHIAIIHGQPDESLPLGWYLIDLNSVHGTFIEYLDSQSSSYSQRQKCKPNKPYYLNFGSKFTLAKSSRMYTVQPDPIRRQQEYETKFSSSRNSAPSPMSGQGDDANTALKRSLPDHDATEIENSSPGERAHEEHYQYLNSQSKKRRKGNGADS
uniref:FHA domain-containing protein n=1 Tax=Aureoumbra lagunensis TaxID=44058 RepID=A0A7S3K424_9STRA|mmetsp:Transcript_21990/g.33938  ORF Transcript_21990/g.33938 Transcript_21990/m.33938 type:complete len:335 (-) Transcript_21990:97-1101(-)